VTAKLNVQYCSATLYDSAECLAPWINVCLIHYLLLSTYS
jgi:hypothetical protein